MPKPPIVVGVDFSPYGKKALEAATQLAKDLDTPLVLVHAYPEERYVPALMGEAGAELMAEQRAEASKNEALLFAENYVQWARDEGVDARSVAADGAPADLILQEADACNAALIVVGTHGHTGLKKLILGSSAEDIVRRSQRPVLVVPGQEEEK